MVLLFQEINVSGRNDAHQLATHFAIIRYGDATEAMASLGLKNILYTFVGAHHYWVCYESLFISLDVKQREWKKDKLRLALLH